MVDRIFVKALWEMMSDLQYFAWSIRDGRQSWDITSDRSIWMSGTKLQQRKQIWFVLV